MQELQKVEDDEIVDRKGSKSASKIAEKFGIYFRPSVFVDWTVKDNSQ